MVTLKDVAERAGVSTATVSYVINNKENKVSESVAKKVREAAAELGYQPNMAARALRSSRSNIIGIISEDIATFQVNNIVQGINQTADRKNYQILLGDLNLCDKIWHDGIQDYTRILEYRSEIQEKIDIFRTVGVGGIIYVGMHDRDITGLVQADVPLVYAYSYTQNAEDYMVNNDNQRVATEAVTAMIRSGHRRVGLISGPVDSVPAFKRLMGYQTALMNAGIAMDPELVAYGNWSVVSGEEACRRLMEQKERPTALFCMNDWMAVGAMKVLKGLGLQIGKDIVLTGFDNIDLCDFVEPALTSVRIPLVEIGRLAAKKVIALAEGNFECIHREELPCHIIGRETFPYTREGGTDSFNEEKITGKR